VHVVDAVVVEQHHIAVDVGASFSLDEKGSLPASPEFALNAYSRWIGAVSGTFDARLVSLAKTAENSGSDQPSPLKEGGNTLNVSGRLLLNADPTFSTVFARQGTQPWLAAVAGLGERSVPGGGALDARPRFFGGLRVQVLGFNADRPADNFGGSRGYLEIGWAKDWFWRELQQKDQRIYAEAQIEIPNVGAKYLRFLVRAAADRAMEFGNGGRSEIRLSVLSSINPSVFGQILGYTAKAPASTSN